MTEKDRISHLAGSISMPVVGEVENYGSGESSMASSQHEPMMPNDMDIAPHERPNNPRAGSEMSEKQDKHVGQTGEDDHWLGRNPMLKRDITFADDPKPARQNSEQADDRMPHRLGTEHHIAFLEKQRNNHTTGTLRIPGPRDFDKGDMPHELGDEDEDGMHRSVTRSTLPASPKMLPRRKDSSDTDIDEHMNLDDHPKKRGITIDIPEEHPRHEQHEQNDQTERKQSTTSTTKGHRFNVLAPIFRLRSQSHEPTTLVGRSMSAFRSRTMTFTRSQDRDMSDPMPYLSWQPTIGRNSMFVDLTEEQREELGGIEYRSLKTLAIILVSYYVGFHLLGIVVLLPWIVQSDHWGSIVDADGQSRVWWGIFTPMSMFTDLGFTLTPDSMESFQTAILPLLLGSFLIIIGNTGFPCMLRFVIWFCSKFVPHGSGIWEELKFLLDHPRRCFTLMFPSKATWWLFWVLVLLNGIDLVLFIILDLNDSTVTVLSGGFRVLNGWFQAVSTRTAGFACVDLANLHPAIQVSYLIMMYISVFPIAISVRRTNVYEEKSLGVWGGEDEDDEEGRSYVGQHLRRQLSFDLWYIFLGFFIIAIVEGGRIQDTNAYAFTMFSILFEIVSSYGTVGLSLGYPGIDASFSAEFGVISKLVIIAMMLRGRHRGLPYALDRAILLPSEKLHKTEDEEARRRNAAASEGRISQDELGLPSQHTVDRRRTTMNESGGAGMSFRHQRRGSEVSTMSKRNTDPTTIQRTKRRLSTVVMAGLSAGPTVPNSKLD